MSIARFSVRQRVLVNLIFVILMVAGAFAAQRVPVDVFPDISFNEAVLITIWPGASASEVERLVTTRIEEEVRDVIGIKEWHSYSSQGASEINIVWDETLTPTEQQSALADLRAAVDRVQDLPEDVDETIIKELSVSEVFDICMVAVIDRAGVGEYLQREVARDLERKVERLPGVRKAKLMSARDRELRIYVDKDRALQFDLTLPEIARVVQANNQNIPGGTFSDPNQREITVRGLGHFASPEALMETVVKKSPDGNHVRLGEVAQVVPDFERRTQYGYLNGEKTITLGISKTSGSDVSEVIARVRALMERERATVPEGIALDLVWDSSEYISERMRVLRDNLILGVVFVVFLLWLSVGFRNAMLAIVGIPFSFLTAFALFPFFGITINSLSLIGFVMVSGMLVDDAIIVIENIYRHIEMGESLVEAAVNGTEEVMWPVLAAVFTTMAAFIPMLTISGTTGEFMEILPQAVILCLCASLVECLLILPAHYVEWGSRASASDTLEKRGERLGPLSAMSYRARSGADSTIAALRDLYVRALEPVMQHRRSFLFVAAAAFFFSCGLSRHVPINLFPSDFNQLFITVQTPTDYSLSQTNDVVIEVQRALEPVAAEIEDVSTYVGFGMSPDEVPIYGSNYGVLYISFPNSEQNVEDPERVLRLMREVLGRHQATKPAGLESILVMPPRNGPPIGKPVAVRIYSDDYDQAKQIAAEIKLSLSGMEGVYNIEDNVPEGRRELGVRLDENRASVHGLDFGSVGLALLAANEGIVPSTFKDPLGDEDLDIRVLPQKNQRRSVSDLLDVDVRTPEGYLVKLRDVATVGLERGYQRLYHYDAQRAVVVYADVDNQTATSTSVNETLSARFGDIAERYPGVHLVFGGEFEETNEAIEAMMRAFVIALLAIYAILSAQFRSYAQPFLVMCVITLAWIGVVIGMSVWGYAISMYVIYAMVGLAGVVVNDSLILIDFVNKQRDQGLSAVDAARVGASRRFRAILLTTLTTVAGLLPMAMGLSGASPVYGPFAAAIVAGLSVASLLTLFVVPCLYLVLDDVKARLRFRGREGLGTIAPATGAAEAAPIPGWVDD